MKTIIPSVLLAFLTSSLVQAAELSRLAQQFVQAAASGDAEALAKTYMDAPPKGKAVKEFGEASKLIAEGKIKISGVERELVIGELGVTLFQIEMEGKKSIKPIICVRDKGEWKIYPWASQSDLNELLKTRTPDEQIHLTLFNKWANLVEEQMEEDAEKSLKQAPSGGKPD